MALLVDYNKATTKTITYSPTASTQSTMNYSPTVNYSPNVALGGNTYSVVTNSPFAGVSQGAQATPTANVNQNPEANTKPDLTVKPGVTTTPSATGMSGIDPTMLLLAGVAIVAVFVLLGRK